MNEPTEPTPEMVEHPMGSTVTIDRPPPIEIAESEHPAAVAKLALTRRGFLTAAVGAGVLAGGGYGLSQLLESSAPPPRFRSRPEFNPPPINVVVPADGTALGLVMLTAARTDAYQHGPLIVDNAWQVVWFLPQTAGSTNLEVQSYNGKPVLTWWEGAIVVPAGYGQGEYVIAGSDYQELTRVRAGNGLKGDLHEFRLTSEGTALFTAYQPVKRNLKGVGGADDGTLLDALLQEVDVSTGKVIFQWSAGEHIGLDESYAKAPSDGSTEWDFFHMNSIDVAGDGNLLISARHTCALYKINRTTGAVMWRLNGKRSDFAMGKRTKFFYQHDARHHADGVLTLFDDGAGLANVEKASRGLKLHVDQDAMRVSLLKEYRPDPSLLATSQGSLQLLPGGNAFVGWGSEPYFSEYGANGGLRFDAHIAGGSNSYRAFRARWQATPAQPPAIAAERLAHKTTGIYASWNGATEVETWNVLSGGSAQSLELVASFARDGFETAMQLPATPSYVAVEALDGQNRVIGHSATVRVPKSGRTVA
jgi:hypothetical protein